MKLQNFDEFINEKIGITSNSVQGFAFIIDGMATYVTDKDYDTFHEILEVYIGDEYHKGTIYDYVLKLSLKRAKELYDKLDRLSYKNVNESSINESKDSSMPRYTALYITLRANKPKYSNSTKFHNILKDYIGKYDLNDTNELFKSLMKLTPNQAKELYSKVAEL